VKYAGQIETCHVCHEPGHKGLDCPQKNEQWPKLGADNNTPVPEMPVPNVEMHIQEKQDEGKQLNNDVITPDQDRNDFKAAYSSANSDHSDQPNPATNQLDWYDQTWSRKKTKQRMSTNKPVKIPLMIRNGILLTKTQSQKKIEVVRCDLLC